MYGDAQEMKAGPRAFNDTDVIILGAGISGLSAAYFLAKKGHSVRVIDSYPSTGGNHLSRQIGPYTFDIGAIFFWSDNPQFRMFEGLLETCVPVDFSVNKVAPSGRVTSYPYNIRDELLSQKFGSQLASFASLLRARMSRAGVTSAADFAIKQIGPKIYEESGLRRYLDRFYGISGEAISAEFAQRRMLWIKQQASLSSATSRFIIGPLKRTFGKSLPGLQAFARPKEGFEPYYKVIEDRLREAGVQFELSAEISKLRQHAGRNIVSTAREDFSAARLINTMPVKTVSDLAGMEERSDLGQLKSLHLTTLFCSTAGEPAFDSIILYNFHEDGFWKRLTLHSAYYGKAEGRHYFAVECTHLSDQLEADTLFSDFETHAGAMNLFTQRLRLEGFLRLEHAYPVYEQGFETILNKALEDLESRGIESMGRQGRFDYIPSSTLAIDLVRAALT